MSSVATNFRLLSRRDWDRRGEAPTIDDLRLGCLQRIADALEAIAEPIIERRRAARDAKRDAAMTAERFRIDQALGAFDLAVGGREQFARRYGDAAMRRVTRALKAWVRLDETADPSSFESFLAFVGNGGEFGCGPKTMAQVREALAERSK